MQTINSTRNLAALAVAAVFITACGGGGGGSSSASSSAAASNSAPVSEQEAARFLTQATYGPTTADIAHVQKVGYDAWIQEQVAAPTDSHVDFVMSEIPLDVLGGTQITMDPMYRSFWTHAVTAQDQLRQRVAFALSEIVVTSAADANLQNKPYSLANHYDVLTHNAFGNYRDLLEQVTISPTMGQYLTMLGNRGDGGRTPDENYAREIMQLFSIGLKQLNNDGTAKLVNGLPVDTYNFDDIRGLAKVFTGWSWGNTGTPDLSDQRFTGQVADRKRELIPMQFYPKFHSPDEKKFLGVTIAAGTPGPQAMKVALDTIFNHPNVGPFLATRLIQRLVTSNPSPAYVGRVASAFNDNGSGVRGDMKATVRAVLLDPEARDMSALSAASTGKLREPVLRVAAFMRAFSATSDSGVFRLQQTDDALQQTPLRAPTVFNFYRPAFAPPNTAIETKGLVAPEFQIANEVSVSNYVNFMQGAVSDGLGVRTNNIPDVRPNYKALSQSAIAADADKLTDAVSMLLTYNTLAPETRTAIRDAVASFKIPDPSSVTGDGKTLVYGGKTYGHCADENGVCNFSGSQTVIYGASDKYFSKNATGTIGCNNGVFGDPIVGTGKSCWVTTSDSTADTANLPPANQPQIDDAKYRRVATAVFMTLSTPEFLVQK